MKDYRVKPGHALVLSRFDADDSGDYKKTDQGKEKAKAITAELTGRIGELQERLYANGTRSLLIVLQEWIPAARMGRSGASCPG